MDKKLTIPTRSDQMRMIIELIKSNPIEQNYLKRQVFTTVVLKRRLKTLVDEGLIQRVGPDKGGSWKILQSTSKESK